MPAATSFSLNLGNLGPRTKKRLTEPVRTQQGIYGMRDATKPLGRAPMSVIEANLGNIATGLKSDLSDEKTARIALLDRGAQEAKLQLGRQFALTPGGTTTPGLQSGAEQRQFETLNTGILDQRDQIAADIAARTAAEQRANVATLQSVQGQLAQQGLSAEQLNLQALGIGLGARETEARLGQSQQQIDEAKRATQAREGLQASELFGGEVLRDAQGNPVLGADGQPIQRSTLASAQFDKTFEEQQRQFDQNLRLQEAGLTGVLRGGSVSADEFAKRLNINPQDKDLIRTLSDAYGLSYDPATNTVQGKGTQTLASAQQALQEEIQRGNLTIEEARQKLNDFVQREQLSLQESQLFGSETTDVTLEEFAYANGLNGRGRNEILRAARQAGFTLDPATNKLVRQTLQAQQQGFAQAAQQAALTGEFIDPETGDKLDTLEKTQQVFNKKIQEAQLTGKIDNLDTLAARSLALQRSELTGQIGDEKTIAQKTLDLQGRIQQGQLALQQQAQAFGQNITEAELTGFYDKMGNETGAFQASFNASEGDANYNERYDFNADGVIDFNDWTAFAEVANNAPVRTLRAQALQEQKLAREFQEKVSEAGLLGTYSGQQTVQEAQRRFDNSMTESQLFVDAPPVTVNMNDFNKSFNSKQGDANYRQDLDTDKDGVINFADFIEMVGSGRAEILSGSVTDPYNTNLTFTYKPEGRMSVVAARLGLDEERLGEETRRFNMSFDQSRNQFLTNTTGVVYDENGEPTNLNTLQKEQFNEAKRQFNKEIDTQVSQFAESLGFKREELTSLEERGEQAALNKLLLAGFGAIGEGLGEGGWLRDAAGWAWGKFTGGGAGAGAAGAGAAGAGAAGAGAGGTGAAGAAAAGAALPLVIAAAPGLIASQLLGTDQKQIGIESLKKPLDQLSVSEIDETLAGIENAERYGPGTMDFEPLRAALLSQKERLGQQQGQQQQPAPKPVVSTYQPTEADFNDFSASYNARIGDAKYDARFDYDGDGLVSMNDYNEYISRVTGRPLGA